jgi:AcrR family transcriptional regulator
MARRPSAKTSINTPLQKGRKDTQLDRLLTAMVDATNDAGYAEARVEDVIDRAEVSRKTFYEYFAGIEDCFLAGVAYTQRRLLARVGAAVAEQPPERAAAASVQALVGFASSEPAMARFFMKETLAGPPQALDNRDAGLDEIARVVERAFEQLPDRQPIPDLPVNVMLGAVCRLLASHMCGPARFPAAMLEDLLGWVESYERAAGEHRWRTLTRVAPPPLSPYLPATTMRAPARLPPGRPRISKEEVAENQRLRIMFATARAVARYGYKSTTIRQIAKLAELDDRLFKRFFADKEAAFAAIYELGFQELWAISADAFFAGSSWPEGIWEGLRAATQSVQRDPTMACAGFVEAYAVGPGAIQRIDEYCNRFAPFVWAGRLDARQGVVPPRLAVEAIMKAVAEVIYRQAHRTRSPQTARLLSNLSYLCLAPFIGPDEATRFIDAKLLAPGNRRTGNGRNQRDRATPGSRSSTRPDSDR